MFCKLSLTYTGERMPRYDGSDGLGPLLYRELESLVLKAPALTGAFYFFHLANNPTNSLQYMARLSVVSINQRHGSFSLL